ncbi:MAG TPA: exosortase A [Methylothermaceae bacterium]|nr:exosortase A [Methylothermaceae bacterium]
MSSASESHKPGIEASFLHTDWSRALVALIFVLAALFAIYWSTFSSMVEIWERSETFTHGYLIFPISLWLIWRRRDRLARLTPKADWRALPVLGLLGFGWLLANVVDVLVVQQLAFVAMIPVLVWAVLGWRLLWEIAFPMAFLFFAVPIGEFLIPPLMNFTADFTVAMIELTGIPVYREGTFFSIPSGDWSVVEGCSGLRYLIASITLGCLYAYLNYRSLWRRLAFIALATFFPIVANGLRAYMIVMIAHLSDMKLALGVDHYIYGWVFFGLVMMLMFWIGSFWREDAVAEEGESPPQGSDSPFRLKPLIFVAGMAVLIAALWPVRAKQIREATLARTAPVTLVLPHEIGGWRQVDDALTDWQPRYLYPDARASAVYSDGDRRVALYLLYYRTQAQGKELVNSQNVLIPQKHPIWKMPWERPRTVSMGQNALKVREGVLESARQKLLVWRWNWISGRFTVNDHLAKLLEARDRLLGHPRDAAGIVLAVEQDLTLDSARQTLRDFTAALLPEIRQALESAERSGSS